MEFVRKMESQSEDKVKQLLQRSHYDFELPKELIAQEPLANREDSRLLVVEREEQTYAHHHTRDLDSILRPGDCLVLNDTKVIPAQLVGKRVRTGGRWQGLVVDSDDQHWRMLAKTRGKIEAGETVALQDRNGKVRCELTLLSRAEEGMWIGRPETVAANEDALQNLSPLEVLDVVGRIPLPHYIRGGNMVDADVKDYQTVYAKQPGAIAAPTAGLHFTPSLLKRLIDHGVQIAPVTLHVGIGTFRPVSSGELTDHVMHKEFGSIKQSSVDTIDRCRQDGGRVIAVGTTSVRVLESAGANGVLKVWQGETDLFIKPGYEFKIISGLLTNFHLPCSTLVVLVRTFGGDELIKTAYAAAIEEEYRFFSYGDAMLIV